MRATWVRVNESLGGGGGDVVIVVVVSTVVGGGEVVDELDVSAEQALTNMRQESASVRLNLMGQG